MGEIIATISKSILVAVIGSAATILINQYWGEWNEAKSDPRSYDQEGPNYRF